MRFYKFEYKLLFVPKFANEQSKRFIKRWNILFFGTDRFSLSSLIGLHNEHLSNGIVSKLEVVTNVHKQQNAVFKFASKNNLRLHEWPLSRTFVRSFDLGIVVSFGHLIPKYVINMFPMGMLNVHASLLPRWRGAAPVVHCLLNGDTHTGISIMKIKPHHFDIGAVVQQKKITIDSNVFQPELYNNLADLGSETLIETLYELPECLESAITQNPALATFAHKIDESISYLNWKKCSAIEIYNKARALLGIFPLLTRFNGKEVKLQKLYLEEDCDEAKSNLSRPGYFEYVQSRKIIRVCCSDRKFIYFNRIKLKGKPELEVEEFKNGYLKGLALENFYFDSL